MSALVIKSLKVLVNLGVPVSERQVPQEILFDIRLEFDFSKCINSDSILDTIDHLAVSQVICEAVRNRSWRLLESMANFVGEALLKEFPAAKLLKLYVEKQLKDRRVGVEWCSLEFGLLPNSSKSGREFS